MTVRVGINGFGRIGRNFFRAAKASGADIDFVAVNDLGSRETMAHLLANDSVHGRFGGKIKATRDGINVDGDVLKVLSERNPEDLPWGELGVDVVIESTGFFTKKEAAAGHRKAGAPKVIISAPSGDCDATFVMGVNEDTYNPARHHVISNASCTTNCFVPMIKVLDDAFGVKQGLMTTDPRLHRRSGARGRAPQRPASRPGRSRSTSCRPVHRRRPGHRPGDEEDARQARWHVAARPDPRRVDHRLHRHPEEGGVASNRSTLPSRRQLRADRCATSWPTPTSRWSRPTSSARPRAAPSTRASRWPRAAW